ncbi:hypothetical protein [Dysgonomonas gadei]|uniref:Alpha-L-rhamnosidase six-hairpin glycosidase domain-containing protein n=1 Tax=Dysgonomonas gadei ATCC BAA-286 TaxID=742766 RepID=F5IZL0_9BACT|nr:hypothetical protein [Dysgonomonas gadei]EGK01134.1 hypothetical protein HMPREF9455_02527 [Dysgonomonas gadei ATCC BAA-286]
MKKKVLLFITVIASVLCVNANSIDKQLSSNISIKVPGNKSVTYKLTADKDGNLESESDLPLQISRKLTSDGDIVRITVSIKAKEKAYYNFSQAYLLPEMKHSDCQFYMPGFWYHRNMRSPKEAPSFHTSDSWQVREDRLSTPLTGIYNEKSGDYYTILRIDEFADETIAQHASGEVILSGKTSIGYTGFRNIDENSTLVFGFPYHEAPKAYVRKLTLIPPVQAFEKLEKGETRDLVWEVRKGNVKDYSAFVSDVWTYSYDRFKPQTVETGYNAESAKKVMTNFFTESFVDKYDLKYFSGVHLRTDDCKSTGSAEVGFVGRVLINAFNALEYGEQNNRPDLVRKANAVLDSYLTNGFTTNGFFREFVDYSHNAEPNVYSIRRQSEGVFSILNYLQYEKKKGRSHPEWESRIKNILGNFLKLQGTDGSFPRKFNDNFNITDASGGSTPSATLPLTMAYSYFKDKNYLESARKTAVYLEKELISKSDYFSSTLDANCEDKEASLYASTAMYYLSFVTQGKEREHYIDLCKESAYFCLSWYYMWDVPFAQGQMLGDVGFKSRGWGNVSVENNHIDVFIFEFATILDWLAVERKEPRFSEFSSVIKSSMLQLMPVEGHMFDIGKVGYYPEVVQHTHWDYGKNGKGFYNDIFAPGWTVASLWQMLSPERVSGYFDKK